MSLPADFSQTLDRVEGYGILRENTDQIRDRFGRALEGVAAVEGGGTMDLGVQDWLGKQVHDVLVAIHTEICDAEHTKLKDSYSGLLGQALTKKGVAAVSAVIMPVLTAINPAFAVSNVVILASIWILNIGLNAWCGRAIEARA